METTNQRQPGRWISQAAMMIGLALLILGFHRSSIRPDKLKGDFLAMVGSEPIELAEIVDRTGAGELRKAAEDEKLLRALLDRAILNEAALQRGLDLGLVRKDTLLRTRVVDQVRELGRSEALSREYPEEELRAYYEKHKNLFVRHPRVRVKECFLRRSPTRDRAEEIAAIAGKLAGGEDWEDVQLGCDSPPVNLGDQLLNGGALEELFGRAYKNAVLSTEAGRWTDPISTTFGQHVVKVEERIGGETLSYDEVKPVVLARYRREEARRALDEYLRTVREEAEVKVTPDAIERLRDAIKQKLASIGTPLSPVTTP